MHYSFLSNGNILLCHTEICEKIAVMHAFMEMHYLSRKFDHLDRLPVDKLVPPWIN